jgi:hypothetical protein
MVQLFNLFPAADLAGIHLYASFQDGLTDAIMYHIAAIK